MPAATIPEHSIASFDLPFFPRALFWIQVGIIGTFIILFPIPMISEDTFFYFQIAENLAAGLGSTFHGYTPTNGYHPLWLLLVTAVQIIVRNHTLLPHLIMGLVLAISVMAFFAFMALARKLQSAFGFLGLAVLAPYCLFTQIGSEANLVVLFLTLSLWSYTRFLGVPRTGANFIVLHLFLALSVLSRLDTVFAAGLIGLMSIVIAIRHMGWRLALRGFAGPIAIHLSLLGGYLAFNLQQTGHLEPISGAIKASGTSTGTIFEKIPTMGLAALALITISFIALLIIDRDRVRRLALLPLYVGVFVHALYILCFMTGETLWTWYYASWMVAAALAVVHVANLAVDGLSNASRPFLRRFRSVIVILLPWFSILMPTLWFGSVLPEKFASRDGGWSRAYAEPFLKNLEPGTGIFVFDYPGALAYFTKLHVLAADGLTSDYRYQSELRREGISRYLHDHDIKYFLGPGPHLNETFRARYCDRLIHQATRFECRLNDDGTADIMAVTVYAGLYQEPVGRLVLAPDQVAFTVPSMGFAVWRVDTLTRQNPI